MDVDFLEILSFWAIVTLGADLNLWDWVFVGNKINWERFQSNCGFILLGSWNCMYWFKAVIFLSVTIMVLLNFIGKEVDFRGLLWIVFICSVSCRLTGSKVMVITEECVCSWRSVRFSTTIARRTTLACMKGILSYRMILTYRVRYC